MTTMQRGRGDHLGTHLEGEPLEFVVAQPPKIRGRLDRIQYLLSQGLVIPRHQIVISGPSSWPASMTSFASAISAAV